MHRDRRLLLMRTVEWFTRGDGSFEPAPGSSLLGVSAEELAAELDWPV
ncbi:hypothetical protein BH20ACT1_BH20ACT1_12970 [soil metagenome]